MRVQSNVDIRVSVEDSVALPGYEKVYDILINR